MDYVSKKKGGFLNLTNEMIIHIRAFSIELHMSVLLWLIIGLFVTVLLCWAGTKFKKADPREAPKGTVLVFEQLVNLCMGVLKANLTNKTWKYLPFMGTVMIMMVISNLMGLLGLQSPTSNLTLDMVLVAMMILLIHGTDIRLHGIIGKLKGWCEPMAFLFPLNVIGDLAFPVSAGTKDACLAEPAFKPERGRGPLHLCQDARLAARLPQPSADAEGLSGGGEAGRGAGISGPAGNGSG